MNKKTKNEILEVTEFFKNFVQGKFDVQVEVKIIDNKTNKEVI